MNLDNITSLINFIPWQTIVFWIRLVFFIVSGLLLAAILFFLFRTKWLRFLFIEKMAGFLTHQAYGFTRTTKRWEKIIKRLDVGGEDEYKTAILEADEMLGDVLEKMGYAGENTKEKLEKVPPTIIPNISLVYDAHRVRNEIVYDPNYKLSLDDAKKNLDVFEKALKDLQLF